jgi:tetratricopeptide (TPR) repeat protein
MPQLPTKVQDAIDRLAEEGNRLMDQGAYKAAEEVFQKGLAQLPEPKSEWEATLWFLTAIGDAQFHRGAHQAARANWRDALLNGGIGNPFVHLRFGQTLYELGQMKDSADELLRALLLAGEDIFTEDDPKYFRHVTSVAQPPAGWKSWKGWKGLDEDSPLHDQLTDPSAYQQLPKDKPESN